jgi:hypothetical protein
MCYIYSPHKFQMALMKRDQLYTTHYKNQVSECLNEASQEKAQIMKSL